MGVYVYRINVDYLYSSGIMGREYENDWLRIDRTGEITVKGSNGAGYSWDGCSPKWKIKDIYFGTPEAVLAKHSLRTKTFYASLVHDALYQFAYELKYIMKRKEADRAFYHLLERDGFRFARLYYFAVRATSWMFWHTKKHKADYHTKKEK